MAANSIPAMASPVVDPSSAIKYESALRLPVSPVFGRRQLRTIKPSEIAAWIPDLDAWSEPSKARRAFLVLHGTLDLAVDTRPLESGRRRVRSRCRLEGSECRCLAVTSAADLLRGIRLRTSRSRLSVRRAGCGRTSCSAGGKGHRPRRGPDPQGAHRDSQAAPVRPCAGRSRTASPDHRTHVPLDQRQARPGRTYGELVCKPGAPYAGVIAEPTKDRRGWRHYASSRETGCTRYGTTTRASPWLTASTSRSWRSTSGHDDPGSRSGCPSDAALVT